MEFLGWVVPVGVLALWFVGTVWGLMNSFAIGIEYRYRIDGGDFLAERVVLGRVMGQKRIPLGTVVELREQDPRKGGMGWPLWGTPYLFPYWELVVRDGSGNTDCWYITPHPPDARRLIAAIEKAAEDRADLT